MEKITNKRVCAFLIDLIIVAVLNISAYRIFHPPSPFLTSFSIEFAYFLLRDSLIQGQSIGKWIIGLRVVNVDGNKCSLKQYLLRNIFFAIPLVNIPCFVIEYFVMAYSREGQRLGDRLAKTRVVDTRTYLKDIWFLFISLLLVFVFFFAGPFLLFKKTQAEARRAVVLLEDYKAGHGNYPEKLGQLDGFKSFIYNFVYTTYFYNGETEFFLTGIAPLHPNKISYSSQRKEWRIHRRAGAWTKEELGIDANFEKANSFYRRGIELQKKGLIQEAIQAFRESVRTKPDCLDCRLGLGFALMKNALFNEAFKEYEEAIRLKPNNLEARLNLFMVLFKQGHYKEALEAYRNYIKLAPPKDEKELKKSDELIRFMEEQAVSMDRDKNPVTVQLSEEPRRRAGLNLPYGIVGALPRDELLQNPSSVNPASENKSEAKEESSEGATTGPKVGNRYLIRFRNGQERHARLVDKDASGSWFEFFEGVRMYFKNDELKEAIESK